MTGLGNEESVTSVLNYKDGDQDINIRLIFTNLDSHFNSIISKLSMKVLVGKDKNFTQLRNQIDRIEASSRSTQSNVYKALVEAIKEFKENGGVSAEEAPQQKIKSGHMEQSGHISENHRYIICFSNEVGVDETYSRIKKEDVQKLLKQYAINLIILCFTTQPLDAMTRQHFDDLTSVNNDGRVIINPSQHVIRDLFLQISNYKFQQTPLILETFN